MIPEFNPGIVPEPTTTFLDLTQYPDAVITTYTDIGLIVMLVGIVCLLAGFYIGSRRCHYGEMEA